MIRPIIKIAKSIRDKNLETASKILLVLIWSISLVAVFTLPDTIPIHFNFRGQPDNYGIKYTLFLFPVLGTLAYGGLSALTRYPHLFNYTVPITEANAERQYTIAAGMMRFIAMAVLLLFSTIIVFTYLTARGMVKGLGWWFLPAMIVLFLVPVAIGVIKSIKEK